MAQTQLMAVLNVTEDSFFAASRTTNHEEAIARGLQHIQDGADILDIGGESTHPKKPDPTSEATELANVLPVIKGLRLETDCPISIDTIKPNVAEQALAAGATLINDVSGFRDPAMRTLAAQAGCPICVMHMPFAPYTTHQAPEYPNGLIESILSFFKQQIDLLLQSGVKDAQIIVDPGLGGGQFGKTLAHNLFILQNLHRIKGLGYPVLLGTSRKTFIREFLNCPTEDSLNGTLVLNSFAINGGVDIIRVHDVKEHRQAIDLITAVQKAEAPIPLQV